ncbi:DNA-binding response regulator [Laceyella sacchari]|uniref:DNA-binding response regulator, OmpR family, contains REC and winged-helix (WHTH) domain n=1 Tax=Laceyella tengchongensis TaxID=574699 RepID=A0AA46AD77_9BACL|nr:DNA-binding response regulator [Laceyella sacchari]SMP02935.1 DNA-binding response regulator, OmpR family, contains REC and winged-helix (wHTH) domain [Laceyella tengchongensis]
MVKRVLIIEDDTSIAQLQKDYLEVNGFLVEVEHSGHKGLQAALGADYDLIVLDLMLPNIDGFEVCRRIRAEKDVCILLVTARNEDIDKIKGFSLGADDYITKPFSPGEFVARVKAHLARYERLLAKREEQQQEIHLRDVVINQSSHRVHVRGREVFLTSKEFELLCFFANHPNHVFSKENLFDRLWGVDATADLSTVTVHVRRLREKIEANPSRPQLIETVWGAGYRLNV